LGRWGGGLIMECSCFDANVDDYVTVIEDIIRTDVKVHKCYECGRDIVPGERYKYEKIVNEGHHDDYKTCIDCASVREHLVCSFYYGDVWELVRESISYYTNDYPWSKIAKLTPTARGKVCEIIESQWDDEECDD
jgi:hypothetical protein